MIEIIGSEWFLKNWKPEYWTYLCFFNALIVRSFCSLKICYCYYYLNNVFLYCFLTCECIHNYYYMRTISTLSSYRSFKYDAAYMMVRPIIWYFSPNSTIRYPTALTQTRRNFENYGKWYVKIQINCEQNSSNASQSFITTRL